MLLYLFKFKKSIQCTKEFTMLSIDDYNLVAEKYHAITHMCSKFNKHMHMSSMPKYWNLSV